jgi:hypothetical protein
MELDRAAGLEARHLDQVREEVDSDLDLFPVREPGFETQLYDKLVSYSHEADVLGCVDDGGIDDDRDTKINGPS